MDLKQKTGKASFDYHCSGFHCAEAVLKAVVETYNPKISQDIPRAATAFGAGLGPTQDICGAITGGVIAIGCLFGRNKPGVDWTVASEISTELIQRCISKYGTTKCTDLLKIFGPQDKGNRCKQFSGEVASMLVEIIEKRKKTC